MTTTRATGRLRDRARARNAPGLVLPVIQEHLLKKMSEDDGRDQSVIHASEMAKEDWCIRATYWRIMGRPPPPREYTFVLENILAEGTAIHEKWQTWLAETGRLWGDWECASDCCGVHAENYLAADLAGGHSWRYKEISLRCGHIVGHADGAIDDTLIELKSVGIGTLRSEANSKLQQYYIPEYKLYDLNKLWADLSRPFMSHLRQGNVYLWLAEQMGLPYKQITFVYEFKPFQQVKEFTVTKSDAILNPLLDKATKLKYALAVATPPACEFGGCDKCKAYEGDNDRSAEVSSGARRVRGGSGSRAGAEQGEVSGAQPASAPRKRRTTAATRDDGPGRQPAHEPVQPARRVVGLSGRAAEPRPGGRGARKVRALQD